MVEIFVVAAGRKGRALQTDDAAEFTLIFDGDLENDRTAHRTADDYGPNKIECSPNRANQSEIMAGREPEFLEPPVVRRIGTSVIRHIKRDDAILLRYR